MTETTPFKHKLTGAVGLMLLLWGINYVRKNLLREDPLTPPPNTEAEAMKSIVDRAKADFDSNKPRAEQIWGGRWFVTAGVVDSVKNEYVTIDSPDDTLTHLNCYVDDRRTEELLRFSKGDSVMAAGRFKSVSLWQLRFSDCTISPRAQKD